MNDTLNRQEGLNAVSRVLIRCFASCVLFLILWFCLFIVGGESGYRLHSRWFSLSRHEYDLINYCGMGLLKICNLLFFLFPYLAIRWTLKRKIREGA